MNELTKKDGSKESKLSLEEMAVSNKQARDIAEIKAENLKLKDFIGKKIKGNSASNTKKGSSSSIVGLQKFKGFRSK